MIAANHIVDTQLPLELNFKSLKEQGLAYIQKYGSTAWTNLNPSDPGITILDQICYALTELGYCANFPMKDILTDKNGALQWKDQFYKPADILTTNPITIADYLKFIIDNVNDVQNAVITPITTPFLFAEGVYQVYIQVENYTNDSEELNVPVFDTFYSLNSCRNIGELFLMPEILQPKTYTITGNLELKSGYEYHSVLKEILQTVNDYVFPKPTQTGYDTLINSGAKANTIFNGPKLDNGWVPDASLQAKKDSIQTFEITKLIQGIAGVAAISKVQFSYQETMVDTATCHTNEIITFEFSKTALSSVSGSKLQVHSHGKQLNPAINSLMIEEFAEMQQTVTQLNSVASVQTEPELPEGKYREISDYYSIQHTFPEAFAVGANAVNEDTPQLQKAQSKQLKGYLTIMDQLLANQFSQLANLGTLFSFQTPETGNPTALDTYYSTKTAAQKAQPKYPVPFEVFSPTYFYQSVYKSVPDVEPLLRNNDIFQFGPVWQDPSTQNHKNWIAYQDDPYNSYMYGLLTSTQDETVNVQRRNEILDHLLARHGESPQVIDTIIYGTTYSGDVLKDHVVIKSLYLQNYGTLSYNKTKSYNAIGASFILETPMDITDEVVSELLNHTNTTQLSHSEKVLKEILINASLDNAMLNMKRISAIEKITPKDYLQYSTIVLKFSLLMALRQQYANYLEGLKDASISNSEASLALWMLTEQKGMMTIETGLLMASAKYQVYFREDTHSATYYRLNTMLSYEEFLLLINTFNHTTDDSLKTLQLTKITSDSLQNSTFTKIPNTTFEWTANAVWDDICTIAVDDSLLDNTLLFLLPAFMPEFMTPDFQQRAQYFMETQLPLHLTSYTFYATAAQLNTIIPLFAAWYRSQIYNTKIGGVNQSEVTADAGKLMNELINLKNLTAHA